MILIIIHFLLIEKNPIQNLYKTLLNIYSIKIQLLFSLTSISLKNIKYMLYIKDYMIYINTMKLVN